jgi:ribosomal protein S18 acetylase RimI-like enzyme
MTDDEAPTCPPDFLGISETVMPYHLRLLTADDAPRFRALRLEALQRCPHAFGGSYADEAGRTLDEVKARLAATAVFGALVEGELCGLAGFAAPPLEKKRHKGTLWGVYVRPGVRREGLGSALIAAVIGHARERCEQLHTAVVLDNHPARTLYRKLGFTPYGIEPRALKVDGRYLDEELLVLRLDRSA